jgi:hypothetical protein
VTVTEAAIQAASQSSPAAEVATAVEVVPAPKLPAAQQLSTAQQAAAPLLSVVKAWTAAPGERSQSAVVVVRRLAARSAGEQIG